jgi:hypothetical protein
MELSRKEQKKIPEASNTKKKDPRAHQTDQPKLVTRKRKKNGKRKERPGSNENEHPRRVQLTGFW